jgi:hypothetical protein
MSHFISLDDVKGRPAEPRAFELWLPNPIMGRALFLRLPLVNGWTFEFNPAEAVASQYVVYRDRMWVREGKARILAIRADGSRVEVNVRVKRWKPRIPTCHLTREARSDRLFWRWLATDREETITSRCCRTERQMRICWKANSARCQPKLIAGLGSGPSIRLAQSDVQALLSNLYCH